MPSLVTDNFRVFAAEQFIESLEEPYNSSNTPESDASAAAQAYRSKLYLFTGRSQNWTLEKYDGVSSVTEFSPPEPYDSFNDLNEVYDDMISLKRVNRADLSQVVRRINWQTGVKYDMYRDDYSKVNPSLNGQTSLYESQFYVVNSDFKVYKCIFNGTDADNTTGKVSTVEPTGTETTFETDGGDGYIWKYMYTISISDYVRFVSSDFIPVKTDSSVAAAAVDGAINQLVLTNKGSGITNNTYYCPILGDGSGAVAKFIVTSGSVSTVAIQSAGTGYTRGKVILTEGYASESNALSRTGSVTSLSITVDVVIGPPGGHGSNPALELGGFRVMINKSLDFLEGDGDIPVNSQFRRFGLISDPQNLSSEDLTSTTATACFAVKFPLTGTGAPSGDFAAGQKITQTTTGAIGRVIHYDTVSKVLRYYQNEWLDADSNQSTAFRYKNIPFSGTNQITNGASPAVTGTPDATADSLSFGVNFTNGYATPEVKKNSGNIIYVENRKAVNRSNDQIEDVKLVVEF